MCWRLQGRNHGLREDSNNRNRPPSYGLNKYTSSSQDTPNNLKNVSLAAIGGVSPCPHATARIVAIATESRRSKNTKGLVAFASIPVDCYRVLNVCSY